MSAYAYKEISFSDDWIDGGEYGKTSAGNMATTIEQFDNRSDPPSRVRVLAGAITGGGLAIVSLVLRKVIKGAYNRRRREACVRGLLYLLKVPSC